jgi:polyisoprenoid-binding protein YceI
LKGADRLHRGKTVFVALLAICCARTSAAAQSAIVLDPEASEVSFILQATGHVVRGGFQVKSGELRLESEGGTIVGEIILEAKSAQTGNERRDKSMHRKVLESELYPQIVLRAERFEGNLAPSGASVIELFGTISLHGADHPMTMNLAIEIEGDRFSAESTFSIPYVEWGLRDPSVLFLRVAKAVEVTVRTRGTISPSLQ